MIYLRASLALALIGLLTACGEDDPPADSPASAAGTTASGGSGGSGGKAGQGGKAGTAGAGGSAAGSAGSTAGAGGSSGGAGQAGQGGAGQGGAGQAGSGQAGSGAGGQAAGAAGANAGASGDGGTAGSAGAGAAAGAAGSATAGAGGEAAGQAGSAAAGAGGEGPGGGGGEAGSGGEAGTSAGGEAGAGGSSGGAGGEPAAGAGQSGAAGSGAAGAGGEGGADPAGGSGGASPGGSGGASSGGSSGGDALAALSLEFSSPSELSQLTDLFPALHATLDVDTTTPGHLAMSPVSTQQTHWYSEQHGPLLYRSITGNFVVETRVQVGRASNIDQTPPGDFSAGGFVVRDPSSSQGDESWVMYNIGHQVSSFAREAKTTRPASGGGNSLSTLYLNDAPSSPNRVRLRVCRVGAEFRLYHRHEGEASWVEETYTGATNVQGNGSQEPTPGVQLGGALRFSRPDLPATLQVGLIAGNWAAPFDVRADFDYLRFGDVSAAADCLKNLGPEGRSGAARATLFG